MCFYMENRNSSKPKEVLNGNISIILFSRCLLSNCVVCLITMSSQNPSTLVSFRCCQSLKITFISGQWFHKGLKWIFSLSSLIHIFLFLTFLCFRDSLLHFTFLLFKNINNHIFKAHLNKLSAFFFVFTRRIFCLECTQLSREERVLKSGKTKVSGSGSLRVLPVAGKIQKARLTKASNLIFKLFCAYDLLQDRYS